MKILVTGSTGFVGRHLVPKLLNENHEVAEVTRDVDKSKILFGDSTTKVGFVENQAVFGREIQKFNPEIVIHLASFLTSADDYISLEKLLNANIHFFCKLNDALKDCELSLFINTGTFAEYAQGDGNFDPAYLYSATKTASRAFLDYYSKVYSFNQCTVVPYTIYGGQDSQKKIIDIIYDSLENPVRLDLSPGMQVLDFIHVEDVVDFYLHLVKNVYLIENKANYQLGTGKGTTLRELTGIIERKTGKRANINWGGKPYRPSDVMYAVANLEMVNNLNWRPQIELESRVGDEN